MKKGYLYEKMAGIDEKYIIEAMDPSRFAKKRGGYMGRKFFLLCACLALMVSAIVAVPLMLRDNGDIVDSDKYDFTSPEFVDFEMDGTTLLSYKGGETEELILPEGIEEVADYAFYGNTNTSSIKVISLSSTVKTLGNNAFAGCDELEKLIVGDNAEFIERDGLLMTVNGETIIRYIADDGKTSFVIPDGVKYISAHAFQKSGLQHVTFPEGLLYIGFNAFAGTPLAEINLPDSLIEIADGAFAGCFSAFDGSYPESLKFIETSFSLTPFYLSMLAGKPCPSEDIGRGTVTITEAFRLSNAKNITEQFADVLEYYSTGIIPEDTFCYGGISEGQTMPEGTVLPDIDSVDFAAFQLIERDWSSRTNIDIVIPCDGGYDMLIGYRLYDRFECLYWEDVRWRVETVSFIPTDAAGSADVAIGDWFIEYEMDGESYAAITFTNTKGVSIYEHRFPSDTEYRFTASPDGQSFIVEYFSMGTWNFFIEDLSGKLYRTWWSYEAPCVPYFSKADGNYIPHTATWNTDEATMEEFPVKAMNLSGEFLMNYNTESFVRDDTYIYYDIKYTGNGIWGDKQIAYDGSDRYRTYIDMVFWIGEADLNGEIINDRYDNTKYSIIYDGPHTWDTENSTNSSIRTEYYGCIIKVPENFEMKLQNSFSANPEGVDASTFSIHRGNGVYIKEWWVVEGTQIIVDSVRKTYFVEIRTVDDYIIPIVFYAYSNMDSADYFENVLMRTVESVRLCEAAEISELSAEKTDNGNYMNISFNDSGKSISARLPLEGIIDLESYTKEKVIIFDPATQFDFLGMFNYSVLKSQNGDTTDYYLYFEGVFTGTYSFILDGSLFDRIE